MALLYRPRGIICPLESGHFLIIQIVGDWGLAPMKKRSPHRMVFAGGCGARSHNSPYPPAHVQNTLTGAGVWGVGLGGGKGEGGAHPRPMPRSLGLARGCTMLRRVLRKRSGAD